jgi:hypothetical protein
MVFVFVVTVSLEPAPLIDFAMASRVMTCHLHGKSESRETLGRQMPAYQARER